MSRHRQGLALCLTSATCFGAAAAFATLYYDHGGDVLTLLALRFSIAAVVVWAIAGAMRAPLPDRRTGLGAALLGVGYAAQAYGYFASLQHLSASMAALLLYTYPAMVFLAALALGRETASAVRLGALGLSAGGTVFVLAASGTGALNATGVALALGAAAVYSGYILVADRVLPGGHPFALTAIVFTVAALVVGAVAPFAGGVHLGRLDATGWTGLLGVTLVSTTLAGTVFLLGLRRIGPSTASIVSTWEPVVTVGLAALCFGERLRGAQLVGGALVLAAVVLLQRRPSRTKVPVGVPADHAAAPAPAGTLATQPS